jgi:hypothetical protein
MHLSLTGSICFGSLIQRELKVLIVFESLAFLISSIVLGPSGEPDSYLVDSDSIRPTVFKNVTERKDIT